MLAARLLEHDLDDPVVVALPRGGVPVGFEVATALGAPLDIGLVRKLGHPNQPELGPRRDRRGRDRRSSTSARWRPSGSPARRSTRSPPARPPSSTAAAGSTAATVPPVPIRGTDRGRRRRRHRHRRHRRRRLAGPEGSGRRARDPRRAGLPGGHRRADRRRHRRGREPRRPAALQQRRRLVRRLLPDQRRGGRRAARRRREDGRSQRTATSRAGPDPSGEVSIPTSDGVALGGALRVPPDATGLVVFVHGSGSSRHSPRNNSVARYLEGRGFATLLFDLLTPEEAADRRNVFDIELLTGRLARRGRLGAPPARARRGSRSPCFGASTGAAAALKAAAEPSAGVGAVVSRGGRPDLAGDALARVTVPTLLIVGGADTEVLALNRAAAAADPRALPDRGRPRRRAPVRGAGNARPRRPDRRRLPRDPDRRQRLPPLVRRRRRAVSVGAPPGTDPEAVAAIDAEARPITGAPGDYDELIEQVGDARVVLLGEATHGTHEFYRHRAVITKRLIEEKGFTAVAVEADWPDAYRVNRWVQGADDDPDAERALGRVRALPDLDVAERRRPRLRRLAACAQRKRRPADRLLRSRPLQPLPLDRGGRRLPRADRSRRPPRGRASATPASSGSRRARPTGTRRRAG